jgi:23S rRNA pseudouridine1911/1915/1917 synthase
VKEPIALIVPPEARGSRLDRFVARALGISRAELQRWIGHGGVTVNGTARTASATIREGERVLIRPEPPAATHAIPEAGIVFEILHTDEDVVVVNKPAGLVVHPARGHVGGTLVNGLLALGLFRLEDWAEPVGTDAMAGSHTRPGIVHRLDKGTSGVMVVARTVQAREALKAQFQAHSIERAYEAIAVGDVQSTTMATLHGRHPGDRKRFTTRVVRGKHAVTHIRVLARLHGATLVECTLETGRTHQIRVHLAESGNPVLGDPSYGRTPRDPRVRDAAERLGRQALHARSLGFLHPRSGSMVRFEAAPPPDFVATLAALDIRAR